MRKFFANTALMHLRKKDILKYPEDFSAVDKEVYNEPSILNSIAAKDLLRLIASMPPGFRTVFNLYAIEGFTHQEISESLKISESNSRSQLSRARVWLKEHLSDLNIL